MSPRSTNQAIPAQLFWNIPEGWAVTGLMLLALATRIIYLTAPVIDSDMAMVGLMGMHMQEGEFPVFWWTSHYGGTFESLLTSIFFSLFGVSRQTLSFAPILMSLLMLLGLYLAARELYGVKAALLALFLAALGPFHLTWTSVLPRGIYMTMLASGAWIFWITLRLVKRGLDGPGSLGLMLAWGLLAGLTFWTHFLSVFFLVPAALVLWRSFPKLPLKAGFGLMVLGFLATSSPFWWYQITYDWATLRYMAGVKQAIPLAVTAWTLFVDAMPVMFGVQTFFSHEWIVPVLGPVALVLSAAVLLWVSGGWGKNLWGRIVRGREGGDGSEMLLLTLLFMLAMCLASGWELMGILRYLLPLYIFLSIAVARVWRQASAKGGWRRWAGWAVVAVVAVSNLAGTVFYSPFMNRESREAYAYQTGLARGLGDALEKSGEKYAYVFSFDETFRPTFDAAERGVFVEGNNPSYRWRYMEDLLRSPRPAGFHAGRGWIPIIEEILGAMGAKWQVAAPPVDLIHGVTPPPTHPKVWLEARPQVRVSGGAVSAPGMLDLNSNTAWCPAKRQAPGQEMVLDLGRPVDEVCQVLLFTGRHAELGQMVTLEAGLDGRNWEKLGRMRVVPGAFFWEAGRLVSNTLATWQEFRFPPRTARYLRLTLGADFRYPWVVTECLVGVDGGRPQDPLAAAQWISGVVKDQAGVWAPPVLDAFLPPRLQARENLAGAPEWMREYLEPALLMPQAGPRGGPLRLAVMDGLAPAARRTLAATGHEYEEDSRHGYTLFTARPEEKPRLEAVASALKAVRSGGGLEYGLGGEREFDRLVFSSPKYLPLDPAVICLEAEEGGQWKTLEFRANWNGRLYWAGLLPLAAESGSLTLTLPETRAGKVRVLSSDPFWTLPGEVVLDVLRSKPLD